MTAHTPVSIISTGTLSEVWSVEKEGLLSFILEKKGSVGLALTCIYNLLNLQKKLTPYQKIPLHSKQSPRGDGV